MKGLFKKVIPAVLAVSLFIAGAFPNAVYAKAVYHNVTFLYGTKMVTQQVKHGQNATVPTDTDVAGYAFSSWIGNANNVTEDRIILGAYNKDTYTTYATADSNVVVSKYGLPVFQPQPTVRINSNKTAEMPSWWADLNMPKGVPGKTCAVHFYNGWNGEYWMTKMVPYGGSCDDPGNPCLSGFQFVGWEGDWTNVTEDRYIKAWYFVTHKVTFKCSECGETLDTQQIRDGESARDVKSHAGKHNKEFDHWDGDTSNITSDVTFYTVYK